MNEAMNTNEGNPWNKNVRALAFAYVCRIFVVARPKFQIEKSLTACCLAKVASKHQGLEKWNRESGPDMEENR